jgi:hypothetical protein
MDFFRNIGKDMGALLLESDSEGSEDEEGEEEGEGAGNVKSEEGAEAWGLYQHERTSDVPRNSPWVDAHTYVRVPVSTGVL